MSPKNRISDGSGPRAHRSSDRDAAPRRKPGGDAAPRSRREEKEGRAQGERRSGQNRAQNQDSARRAPRKPEGRSPYAREESGKRPFRKAEEGRQTPGARPAQQERPRGGRFLTSPWPAGAPLFASLSAETRNILEALPEALNKVWPLNAAHRRSLPEDVEQLSRLLTTERAGLARPYWSSPASISAYLYYFLPWNLVRLTRLLATLPLPDPRAAAPQNGEALLIDVGSGPLTLPLALWLARPQWRSAPLQVLALDTSSQPLELGRALMHAVENDEYYDLIAPNSGEVVDRLRARAVFDLLVKKAWQSGDPGIVFLDRINRDNPTPDQGEIESTNPCGEQPLLPYEACNLGSINLSCFHIPGVAGGDDPAGKGIDWNDLRRVVHLAVRFLDNVIDASRFPLERITETVHKNRKIGLGVMGFADLLYQLGVSYDSQQGLELGERIMAFIQDEGHKASAELAQERGPFPAYAASVYAQKKQGPYRNATVTTIAPTGTLSIIAGCSSGVEPLFALCFTRNILDGERLVEVNPHFENALADAGLFSHELMDAVVAKGSIQDMDFLPAKMRKVFVTAMDIAPAWHLRMQAAFQRHTDNAVSKTVNLSNSATEQDIFDIYWMAFQEGCKGVTVYRDGCKSIQVLATGEGQKKMDGETAASSPQAPAAASAQGAAGVRKRPDIVWGFTQKVPTGLGVMQNAQGMISARLARRAVRNVASKRSFSPCASSDTRKG